MMRVEMHPTACCCMPEIGSLEGILAKKGCYIYTYKMWMGRCLVGDAFVEASVFGA